MTDRASPAGWVIQVTIPAPLAPPMTKGGRWLGPAGLDAPSFQYFNVAIAAPDKAMEATTKHLAKGEAKDGEISAVRGLSSREIAALGLQAGEVRPA
jgi:hypothetical protein